MANNWVMANYEVNFNGSQAHVTRNSATHLNRGMGVISDADGNLLFYTDGFTVWNKTHYSMPNGTGLIPFQNTTSTQSSLVVPKPGSNSIYYVFTVDPWNGQATSGLYYSEIDMQLAGGLGDVTVKGVRLVPNTSNKLSAAYHADQENVWLITHQHNTNTFFVLQITSAGISSTILNYSLGPIMQYWNGQMKFSPDGKKIAVSFSDPAQGVTIMDFDPGTGVPSNPMVFDLSDYESSPIVEGADFSSDGTKVYVAEIRSDAIYQLDLSLPTYEQMQAAFQPLGRRVITNSLRQFQLAPDGRIYITKGGGGGGTAHLGVIVNPNAPAANVVFQENGLYLQGGDSFVGYTPNFIQDYLFRTSFRYSRPCEDSEMLFEVTNTHLLDSAKWFFGEGSSSTDINPTFTYAESGNYAVRLIAYYTERTDTIEQQVTVNPSPFFDLGPDKSICSGTKISIPSPFESYLWSTADTVRTIRVEEGGTYTATVTNQFACLFSDTITLTVNPLPNINLTSTIAMGDAESIELQPGSFQSYSWSTRETSPTIHVSKRGWYSVLVTDSEGCMNAKTVYVSRNEALPPVSYEKWTRLNPAPSANEGRDIAFADDRTGFLLNSKQLLKTTNAGQQWSQQMKVPSGRRLAFKNLIGYIVGDSGVVYKSTHLGGGWNKLDFVSADHLNAITLLHPDSIIVTSDNKLYLSSDGGHSWIARPIPGVDVEDSHFTSWRVGHVASQEGRIMKTTDGGVTWRTTSTGSYNFTRIRFMTPQIGFASGNYSELYKTTNGGETWTHSRFNINILSFCFPGNGVGFVAGEYGGIYKTTDGGANWVYNRVNTLFGGNDLLSIYFNNDQEGYATGLNGRIHKTINGGNTWAPYSPSYWRIDPVDFPTPQVGYYLSGDQLLAKSTDEGTTWSQIDVPLAGQKCTAFDFVTANLGYALVGGTPATSAYSGMVYKTNDGGLHWAKTHANYQVGSSDFRNIYFLDENVGFVSGTSPYGTLRTSDGGATWVNVGPYWLDQMHFFSTQVGFARGYPNKILKTTDGGQSWSILFQPNYGISSISFVNDQLGYMVREYFTQIYKTTNGGLSWQPIGESSNDYYSSVKFINADYGYLITTYGKLLRTTNGGVTWTLDYDEYGLNTFYSTPSKVFAIGEYGSLIATGISLAPYIVFGQPTMSEMDRDQVVINSAIHSTKVLSSAVLVAEIGRQSGIYEESYQVEIIDGLASKPITYAFKNLDFENYYCRFVLIENGEMVASPEFAFSTEVLGMANTKAEPRLKAFPNPATETLSIAVDIPGQEFSYEIRDIYGRTLISGVTTDVQTLSISSLTPGMYLLTVITTGFRSSVRVVKK